MSQKENKFQSKSKKTGGGGKGRGKPAGRGFNKKFEGDKGRKGPGGGKPGGKPGGKSGWKSGGKPGGKSGRGGYARGGDRFDDRKGDRRDGDRKGGERSFDGKKFSGKKFGDKKYGDKKYGDKKYGDKKFGDKKFSGRKFDDRKGGPRKGGKFDDRKGGGPRRYDNRRDDRREAPAPRTPASAETRQRLKSDRPSLGAPSAAYLYGLHPVGAALLNPDRVHQRLLVTENGLAAIQEVYDTALAEGLKPPAPQIVDPVDLDRLLPREAVHQGVLLDSQPLEEVFLQDVIIGADENAKIVVLDQVTDPHNVGAILRSAAAFGAVAVVMQKLNAPDVTGTLAKSASGAVEHVPLVREVNLSRALKALQDEAFVCIGLDERGKKTIAEAAPKDGRIALVMGAEGDGLRRLVAETCNTLARLPTQGAIASLNVSNAAAVALYEIVRED